MKPTYFIIERFSHHFVVRDLSVLGAQLVNVFCSQYIDWRWVGSGRYARREMKCIYAVRVAPEKIYRFHHGQWDAFVQYLSTKGINIRDIDVLKYGFNESKPLNSKITDKKTPYDYQVKVIDYLTNPEPSPIKLVEIQTGKGKALPLDALLLTSKGRKSLGALQVGDFIVDRNYMCSRVTGKFMQGMTPMIEFVTEDGRLVETSDEHLWNAADRVDGDLCLVTSATMAVTLKHGEGVYLKCPMHNDGRSKIPENITQEMITDFMMPSAEVYEGQPYTFRFETVYLAILSSMISCGSTQNGEFIIDLSAHINQKAFADFVWYIGGSLVPVAAGSYKYYVRTPYNDLMYATLKEQWKDPLEPTAQAFQYTNGVYLKVTDYEVTPERETCCITVENDDREFIVGDYLVTHNTFCAMSAAVKLNKKILMFLKPQFIKKWISDCKELIGADEDQVLVIKGSNELMKAIDLAKKKKLDKKVIIISNRTFQNWIKEYERIGEGILDIGYGCLPNELFEVFNVGLRLIDEVHLDFHLNFKIDLYTHVEYSISLSATLISDNQFITNMQRIAYPTFLRYAGLPYDKYVRSVAWCWSLATTRMIQTSTRGRTEYSHIEFEKSILKNRKLLEGYLKMHVDILKRYHFNRAVEGDTCLIYCASIAMCTIMNLYLKSDFPGVDVQRYVETDGYANLLEATITVSTLLSAGTGHDKPGLITVILGHSIKSSSSNMQGFGRIRKLKDKDMLFIYLTCIDIPKQVEYYETKEELLKTMALSTARYDQVNQLG